MRTANFSDSGRISLQRLPLLTETPWTETPLPEETWDQAAR